MWGGGGGGGGGLCRPPAFCAFSRSLGSLSKRVYVMLCGHMLGTSLMMKVSFSPRARAFKSLVCFLKWTLDGETLV